MTVKEAIDLLYNVTGQLKMSRVDHIKVQQAIDMLDTECAKVAKMEAAEEKKAPLDNEDKALA